MRPTSSSNALPFFVLCCALLFACSHFELPFTGQRTGRRKTTATPPPSSPHHPLDLMSSVHPVPPTNVAFVFVKPAAYNPAVVALVHEQLAAKGIHITAEGTVPTERIDKEGIIDRHYYTIARYALEMAPFEVVVPGEGAAAFEKSFGQSWLDAVQKGLVINAATAEALLGGVAPLKAAWNLAEKRAKLAPGLYASLIEAECAVKGHYVLNGFYPGNREKFTAPGGAVHWMVVEWEEETLSWASFRAEVIGATNPAAAAPGSIRATLLARWQELGLAAAPDNSDNGVHGSASPIEGLSERRTWLGANPADKFAAYLASKHLDPRFVDALMTNPMAALNGRNQPIFDLLEDRDASIVAALLPEVVLQEGEPAAAAPPAPAVEAVVKVTPAPTAAPAAAAPAPASPAPAPAVAQQQQLSVASPPQLRPVSPSEGRPVTPYRSPSKMTEREAKLHALRSSTISSQTSEREMRGYFDLFDADHNGFISRDEFKREWALFENYGLNPPQKQLDELFDKFDFKHDGRLSFDEFVLLMCKRVTM